MKKNIFTILSISTAFLFFTMSYAYAQTASFSFLPVPVIQGEALMVQMEGVMGTSLVKNIKFDGKKVSFFTYQGKPTAIIGIDLLKKSGFYELMAELVDGSIVQSVVFVGEREKFESPLGIPDKLGGNTKVSQDKLVSTLAAEKKATSGLRTAKTALWSEKFIPPLKDIVVTSPYGFSRLTGVYSIPHKGVDYRAPEGTEVMATNRGIVRVSKTFRNYGKTVIIDHGLGLMSLYMHLSKSKVKVGDTVARGQVIALSGHSGYTLGAHLHFAIRINDIGVDPVRFLEMFK